MEVTPTFREAVRMYNHIFTKKAEVNKDMLVLNKKLKELKAYIVHYMSESKIDACNVGGSRLALAVTRTKESLNEEALVRLITEFHKGDPTGSRELAEYILANRRVKESHNLRQSAIPGYQYIQRDLSARAASAGGTAPSRARDQDAESAPLNTNVLRQVASLMSGDMPQEDRICHDDDLCEGAGSTSG